MESVMESVKWHVTLLLRPYTKYAAKRLCAQSKLVVKLPPASTICC